MVELPWSNSQRQMRGYMRLKEVVQAYPYCYHVTFARNLPEISSLRALLPARALILEAGRPDLLGIPRRHDVILDSPRCVTIRNQRTVVPQFLDLSGLALSDYISYLNSRTFFFPGGSRPSNNTIRLWRRAELSSIILRTPMRSLMEANPKREILAADCNVGATWNKSHAKVTRRGDEFRLLSDFAGPPSRLVELSILESACLPNDTVFTTLPNGIWMPLAEMSGSRKGRPGK
jgi:hypothetical protein